MKRFGFFFSFLRAHQRLDPPFRIYANVESMQPSGQRDAGEEEEEENGRPYILNVDVSTTTMVCSALWRNLVVIPCVLERDGERWLERNNDEIPFSTCCCCLLLLGVMFCRYRPCPFLMIIASFSCHRNVYMCLYIYIHTHTLSIERE